MRERMVDNKNRCLLCLESQETAILRRNSFNSPLTTESLLAFMNAYCISPTRGLVLLPELSMTSTYTFFNFISAIKNSWQYFRNPWATSPDISVKFPADINASDSSPNTDIQCCLVSNTLLGFYDLLHNGHTREPFPLSVQGPTMLSQDTVYALKTWL